MGIIRLFSDKDSLDELSVTTMGITKEYKRVCRFSITHCVPVPLLVCLWREQSLPEQLLRLRNENLRWLIASSVIS